MQKKYNLIKQQLYFAKEIIMEELYFFVEVVMILLDMKDLGHLIKRKWE